jgi:hypothetical protein
MRTTLDLPEDLLDEALKLTKEKNKTSLIINSIKSTIRRHKVIQLMAKQGKIDVDIDLAKLRKKKK